MGSEVHIISTQPSTTPRERAIEAVVTTLVVIVALAAIASGVGAALGVTILATKTLVVISITTGTVTLGAGITRLAVFLIDRDLKRRDKEALEALKKGQLKLNDPRFKIAIRVFLRSLATSSTMTIDDGSEMRAAQIDEKKCELRDNMLRHPNLPNEVRFKGKLLRSQEQRMLDREYDKSKGDIREFTIDEWSELILSLYHHADIPFEGFSFDQTNPMEVMTYFLEGTVGASSFDVDNSKFAEANLALTPAPKEALGIVNVVEATSEKVVVEARVVGQMSTMDPQLTEELMSNVDTSKAGGLPPLARVLVNMRYTITKQESGNCHIAIERSFDAISY